MKSDILQGTLDMLILKALELGPMHGYGISKRIHQISNDALRVEQGSLYPAIHRLEQQGWITAEWGLSDNNRRARFYCISAAGQKQLAVETKRWNWLSAAVNRVLAS